MGLSEVMNLIKTIFVLIGVIFLANYLLKLLNNFMLKQNKAMKIHEKLTVGNNSSIGIVEIMGNFYLMSFTSNENNILKELEKEEVMKYLNEKDVEMKQKSKNIWGMRGKSE